MVNGAMGVKCAIIFLLRAVAMVTNESIYHSGCVVGGHRLHSQLLLLSGLWLVASQTAIIKSCGKKELVIQAVS